MNTLLNNASLTIDEISKLCDDLNIQPDIFIKNKNEKIKLNPTGYSIILLHPPSGHYVAQFQNCYFDSYAVAPSEDIQDYNKFLKYYNTYQIQDINDGHCGQYCCYWIYCCLNNLDFFKYFNIKYSVK